MKKLLLLVGAIGLIAASWTIGPAVATSLSSTSQTVGTGNGTVARCDGDGFAPYFILSGSNVASVYLSDIATPACDGATLNVTVNNGLTSSSGTVTIPSGGAVTVDIAPDIALRESMQTEMVA